MADADRHADGGNLPKSIQSADFVPSELAHARRHDRASCAPAVRFGGLTRSDGQAYRQANRNGDLSRRLLPH